MKSGIYKIENIVNGKMYVGRSKNINKRLGAHKSELRHNKHGNPHLQAAWNKYDETNFICLPIEFCDIDLLKEREDFWIKELKTLDRNFGYNIKEEDAQGRYTEEYKEHLSNKSKQQHQKAKQEGKYKVVVIDLVTNEKEYFDTIKECPVKFHTYYNFVVAKCYFNLSTNLPEEIEVKIIKTKLKYQKYLESQQSRPIFIYKKKTNEFIGMYNSISEAARQLNISCKNLSGVLNRDACKSVKGYVPSYTQIHSSIKTGSSSNSIAFT